LFEFDEARLAALCGAALQLQLGVPFILGLCALEVGVLIEEQIAALGIGVVLRGARRCGVGVAIIAFPDVFNHALAGRVYAYNLVVRFHGATCDRGRRLVVDAVAFA